MKLEILTPEKVLYKGEATLVQLPGVDGLFEILDHHAPLIASLGEGTVKYQTPTETVTVEITGGFAECAQNTVNVLVEGVK